MDEENWDASIHLIGVSSLVRMSEPRFRPLQRFVQESRHHPFGTGLARPVRLHAAAIIAPRIFHGYPKRYKFAVTQNVERSFVT